MPLRRDTARAEPPLPVSTSPLAAPRPAFAFDTTAVPGGGPLLDAPISRTEYVMGPGDRVHVSVFGEVDHLYSLVVGPEGSLVIPGMGIASVLGLTVERAEQRVRALAARYFRNIDVRLTLAGVRQFKVFVVGDVPAPGVRTATAATRVSEVVGPVSRGDIRGGRNLVLRRAGGDSVRADLVRFAQAGDVSANPTLREGDAILVPALDEFVRVVGRVHYPARYEYRSGESLADLLWVVNGGAGFPADAADTVRVVRFTGPETRTEFLFTRDEATGARGRGFALQPFDGIFVAGVANHKQQQYAIVAGQVDRPGTYPIRPDTTTLRELVLMAGGFTPQASVGEATLRRDAQGPVRDEVATIPPELLGEVDRRILLARGASDTLNVVVDVGELFTPGTPAYSLTVRQGDVLSVPTLRTDVRVLGAVRTPGLVPFGPGWNAHDYVAAAGGLTRRADARHAVVIRSRTGARLLVREAGHLDPGDMIVIPFREDRSSLAVLQAAATIVSAATGVVLTAVALFN